ncbi:MAG: DUF3179 domain-containing protein [Wenzhouxiangellaceae bacterium]|nr:DUF3179 domain-containing protein [Wenzhouxiangellaceae bacterium]
MFKWLVSRTVSAAIFRISALSLIGWLFVSGVIGQESTLEGEFPKTDFSRSNVDFDEIQSGGPPRDGIPAIDNPRFIKASRADWLHPDEPVIVVTVGEESRAYPLQILIWHEIVNDEIGGKPLAVTFCPLCNAALVFERELDGDVLDFGTTGRLRKSDLIMYDRQTETWWQQFTGEGLIGRHTGRTLTEYPASIVRFGDFSEANPEGDVLSRRTGHNRPYGDNPYRGYDRIDQSPFMFDGRTDPRLPPMERILAIRVGDESRLYPFGEFREAHVVNEQVSNLPVVVFSSGEAFSTLDRGTINQSRRVPSPNAFDRRIDGQTLTFELRDGKVYDAETQSSWNALGQADSGPLAGKRLNPVQGGVHFAFAWLAFRPDSTIYRR